MFPAARRLSSGVARAARSPLALSARKPTQMRRLMSTIPAEGEVAAAEAPKHWARYDNPPMVWLAGILGTVYILALRWALKDKSLAKKMEAMEAEKAAAHAAHAHEEAEAAPATTAAAATLSGTAPTVVVAVVAAAPVNPTDPSTWKVADTCAWLHAQELGDHVESFKAHAVDGKLLLSLTEQEMYGTLGIVSPLRRKKLMMAISELRSAYMNP